MSPKHHGPGFTLLELILVLIIIGTLSSVAVPSLVDTMDTADKVQVQSTASNMRSAVAAMRAKGAHSPNQGGCRGTDYSFEHEGGAVCVRGGMHGPPIGTTGLAGSSTNSGQLWRLLVTSPDIHDSEPSKTGWRETSATGCGDTTYTYCWDYYVNENHLARLRYNNGNSGNIELIWSDED